MLYYLCLFVYDQVIFYFIDTVSQTITIRKQRFSLMMCRNEYIDNDIRNKTLIFLSSLKQTSVTSRQV